MAWDYAYGTRPDSSGSATPFGSAVDNVRILPEVSAPFRGRPTVVAHRPGSVLEGRLVAASFDFVLEIDLHRGTPATPADVYQNRSTVLQQLFPAEKLWLVRTAPHQGTVEIPIVVLRAPRTSNPRNRLRVPCRALDPYWRDASLTHTAVNPVSGVTNSGDAPTSDLSIGFSGTNGVQRLTNTTTGDWIELDADTTSLAITVSVLEGTVKQVATHVDSVMTANNPWLMELVPGANSFTLSGGGSATLSGYDKWR